MCMRATRRDGMQLRRGESERSFCSVPHGQGAKRGLVRRREIREGRAERFVVGVNVVGR